MNLPRICSLTATLFLTALMTASPGDTKGWEVLILSFCWLENGLAAGRFLAHDEARQAIGAEE